jgi:F0F1-type ATP synthase assembly protein I
MINFIAGLIVGAIIGVFMMALFSANGRDDE